MKTVIDDIRKKIKENNPLIHCITNPISIRECANVILSVGARPMMAEHPDEVETVTKSAGALLINLGNLTEARASAIRISAVTAGKNNIPAVLDLCGVACLSNRRELALFVIENAKPQVIKGNYSEIKALFCEAYSSSGVDADVSLQECEVLEAANKLAKKYNSTILASGKIDIITDGNQTFFCENGTLQLATITGTGCMQGALCAAFLSKADGIDAAKEASAMFGICGEIAATPLGSGSFEANLLDALSVIDADEIRRRTKLTEKK